MAGGVGDGGGGDGGGLAKAEVDEGFVGREEAGLGEELAGLDAGGGLDLDGGADGGVEAEMVLFGEVVAVDGDGFVEVGDDEIEVAIVVEVAVGGGVGHAFVVEVPFCADFFEVEVAGVAEGKVFFVAFGGVFPAIPFGGADEVLLFGKHVGVVEHAGGTVGEEDVEEAVVIEVEEFGGPGPVGVGEVGEVGGFEEERGVGIEEEGVAHHLAGFGGGHEEAVFAHFAHGDFGAVVGGAGHVADEEVGEAVVVEVAKIGAHAEPGGVGEGGFDNVGEGAVAVVLVEGVGFFEVVCGEEVGVAVSVVVPPEAGVGDAEVGDAGGLGDVGECGAVVAEEVVAATDVTEGGFAVVAGDNAVVFAEGFLDDPLIAFFFDGWFGGATGGVFVLVGGEVEVEVAIEVVVSEGGLEGGVDEVEAVLFGAFFEAGFVGRFGEVDEELVGGVVVGDEEVEVAVAVDIGESGAGGPGVFEVGEEAGGFGMVGEGEGSIGLEVEGSGTGGAGAEEVGSVVAIEVSDGEAASGVASDVEKFFRVGGIDGVEVMNAGGRWSESGEFCSCKGERQSTHDQ